QRLNGVSSSGCPAARQFDPETMSSPLPRDYCEGRSAPRRPTTRSATRVECIDKKRPAVFGPSPCGTARGKPRSDCISFGAFFGAPLLCYCYFATVRARKLRRVLVLVVGRESQNIP